MPGDVMTTDIVVGRGRGRGRGAALQRPATPAAPAESSALVSGAGTVDANGMYTPRGTLNGRPYYNREDLPDAADNGSIIWNGGEWFLCSVTNDVLYSTSEDVAFPWEPELWRALDGDDPPPTVTET